MLMPQKQSVAARLREQIQARPEKAISFYEFMDICLYGEPGGYYRRDVQKIGRDGDFYTSSSIGTVMGETLAAYIEREWRDTYGARPLAIVEWGGGNGRLALHILDEIRRACSELYDKLNYVMVESSSYHRALQVETLGPHSARVRWVTETELNAQGTMRDTIVLANELLDAFPVHRIRLSEGQLEENRVGVDEATGAFTEIWQPLPGGGLADVITEACIPLREGQIIEWNPDALHWIRSMGALLEQGQLIVIDYGDEAEELFAEHRMNGTLMCYRKHQAHDNPYVNAGEQDITAHVNFTACMRAADCAGFDRLQLLTQRDFLVEHGILHKLQALPPGTDPFSPEARRNRAIRGLLLSDSMSELFKVMIGKK